VHVFNHFRSGAIPNIIRALHPVIGRHFDVEVVVLQAIHRSDTAIRDFEALGIPVHSLECGRGNVPLAWLRLRRFLARARPQVIHAHMGRSELLTPLCRPAGARTFATFHNVRGGYHRLSRTTMRLTDTLVDRRVCVSQAVADSWYGGSNRARASVVHNPIDVGRFAVDPDAVERLRREFGLHGGKVLIVNVGRLTRQKGQTDLVQAAAQLRRAGFDDYVLVIAGRGEEEARLQAQVLEHGLSDHVRLVGFRDDVPALVAAADLFVFPSLWEGLGLAALEAMAAGTAVIASDLPAVREYVADGETGLLSAPGSPQALAERIIALIRDPALREMLGHRGRARVAEAFGAEQIGHKYLDLYRGTEATS
jgi:glycosyltransferase involved in cell wall biosynthesis